MCTRKFVLHNLFRRKSRVKQEVLVKSNRLLSFDTTRRQTDSEMTSKPQKLGGKYVDR
jgi:hypothetical protein